jgi:hypothetical protein
MSVPYATVRVSRDKEIKMTVCYVCEYKSATEVFLTMDKGLTVGLCDTCADNFAPEKLVYIQPIAD